MGVWVGAAVLALVTAIAAPVLAQNGGGAATRPGRAGLRALQALKFRRVARQLGLSDAQKPQVRAIVQSHRDEWKGLAERARTARQALNRSVAAGSVDESAIRNDAAQLAAVQADIAVARAHARSEIWNVLTPDQRTQAEALRSARRNR
jgi:protein CpxP